MTLPDSKKNFALAHYILSATSLLPQEVFYPKDENKKLAEVISYTPTDVTNATIDLTRESSTYLKSWEMTDILQSLEDAGLFMNIRGKKKIKQHSPHALPRLRKSEGYEKSKREGYYSVYKITDNLATLNKVISNPKAMRHIYNKLKDHSVLKKFYMFHGLAVMYALREGDENMFRLATVGTQEILDNNPEAQAALEKAGLDSKQIQYSAWELIKNYLLSLKEEELEKLVEGMVDHLVENPIDRSIFLLALSRL